MREPLHHSLNPPVTVTSHSERRMCPTCRRQLVAPRDVPDWKLAYEIATATVSVCQELVPS
jgi:hypothetical protein